MLSRPRFPLVALAVIGASTARAGPAVSSMFQNGDSASQPPLIIEVIPDGDGVYYGGESVLIDVWLHNTTTADFRVQQIQFDFSLTDSTIELDPSLTFDFSSLDPSRFNHYLDFHYPDLPAPWMANLIECVCPGYFMLVPQQGSLHIASINALLPSDPGTYHFDLLNADAVDDSYGALFVPYLSFMEIWRARTGDIGGGTYDFHVVPEPGTLLLLGGPIVLIGALRRRGRASLVVPRAMILRRQHRGG